MSRATRHAEADELVKRAKDAAAADEGIQGTLGTKDIEALLEAFCEKLDKIATAVEEIGRSDTNFPLRVCLCDARNPSKESLRVFFVKHASLDWTLKMARRVIGFAGECDVVRLQVQSTRTEDDAELDDDDDDDDRTLRWCGVCTSDLVIAVCKPWK